MSDLQALKILTDLRKKAGLTLSEMAARCGLRGKYGYQTASAWERGTYAPSEKSRRKRFMGYLWDDLYLRQDPDQFDAVWKILQAEWGWKPLQSHDWAELAPTRKRPAHQRPMEATSSPSVTSHRQTEQASHSEQTNPPTRLADAQSALGKVAVLPRSKGELFGRNELLHELLSTLSDPGCRLLTLIGPGGIGKTRLGQAVAERAVNLFANGVCFVALAAVEDQPGLVAAIAHALELPAVHPSSSAADNLEQRLLQWLEQREMLLVFDNFEQLLTASPFLTKLLAETESIKLLITSRIRVNLQAEWLVNVTGLQHPLPSPHFAQIHGQDSSQALAEAKRYGAVALFDQSAKRVNPSFELTAENLRAVVHICQLVDGMPLALELASSWARMLTADEIAHEIEGNIDFLSTTMSDVTERHRSIRAVFGYSWRLLSPTEQRALMQLSIFRHGFEREAAADVANADLSLLSGLMDKSFLRRVENYQGQQKRFEMHELLRQLIEEQLEAQTDLKQQTQIQFSKWYAAFLVQIEQRINGAEAGDAIRAVDEELPNIRLAWRWLVDQAMTDLVLTSITPLYIFFNNTGRHQEGHDLFQYALDNPALSPPVDLQNEHFSSLSAKISSRLAHFKFSIGQRNEAQNLLEQTYAAIETSGNSLDIGYCLKTLGSFAWKNGDYDQARDCLNRAMSIYQVSSFQEGITEVLIQQGVIAYNTGHLFEAQKYYRAAFQSAQQLNHAELISVSQHNLGQVCQALGEFSAATSYLEDSLKYQQRIGASQTAGYVMITLATIASQQGDHDRARGLASEAVETFRTLNYRPGLIIAYRQLGDTERLAGNFADAAIHLNQSQGLAEEMGLQPQRALCICSQGKLKLDEGDYEKAKMLSEQSMHLCETTGIRAGVGYTQNLLGQIALAKEQYVVALAHFHAGLAIGMEINAVLLANEALLGIGVLLAICNAPFPAAITLQSLTWLSSSTIEIREEAQRWLLELDDQLEPAESQRAKAQAQVLTIESIYSASVEVSINLDSASQLLQAYSSLDTLRLIKGDGG